MRRSTLFTVALEFAACLSESHGQGFVAFDSYSANAGSGAVTMYWGSGIRVSGAWSAELYYALGTVSDPVYFYQSSTAPSSAFTAVPSSIIPYDANGDGYFQGPIVAIPGYVSGPITFEVVAFNSIGLFARSGSFTESTIANSPLIPVTFFGDNGPGMPNIIIFVPEPGTLALAGLGGLVSLVALRCKQSN